MSRYLHGVDVLGAASPGADPMAAMIASAAQAAAKQASAAPTPSPTAPVATDAAPRQAIALTFRPVAGTIDADGDERHRRNVALLIAAGGFLGAGALGAASWAAHRGWGFLLGGVLAGPVFGVGGAALYLASTSERKGKPIDVTPRPNYAAR